MTVRSFWLTGAVLLVVLMSCREVDMVARHSDAGPDEAPCGVHGTQELTDAGTRCRCEAGFISRDPERCEAIGPLTGCDNKWCANGEVCELTSGRCVTVAPEHCGQSPEPIGTSAGPCSSDPDAGRESHCIAGLVCVNQFTTVLPDRNTLTWGGRCIEACDPCAPSCASKQCVTLSGRGGFCAPARLSGLGEPCGGGGVCGAGLVCANSDQKCRRPCLPDEPAHQHLTNSADFDTGFPSVLCGNDELCQMISLGISGDSFVCAGPVAQAGGPCVGVCLFPSRCNTGVFSFGPVADVCTADCSTTPCPEGIDCFMRLNPITLKPNYSCIRDHVLPVNQNCAENRNCAPPLVCRAATVSGTFRCAPP